MNAPATPYGSPAEPRASRAEVRRAQLWMALFAVLWAVVEALASGILQRYSAFQVVFTRYVVHLALMALIWGLRDPGSLVRTGRPLFQLARSAMMVVMPASFVFASRAGVEPRTLTWVFWLSPLLILALATLWLRERPSALAWLGALLAWLGTQLLSEPPSLPALSSALFPVAMASSFGLYVVMTRSLRSESTRANLFYSAFGVAVCLAPLMPGRWRTPTPLDLAAMTGVGVLGFVVLYALDRATALAPLRSTAPVIFVQLPAFFAIELAATAGQVGTRALLGAGLVVVVVAAGWLRAVGSSTESAPLERAAG